MAFPPEIGPYLKALTKRTRRIRLKPKWVGLIAIPLAFGIGATDWKYGIVAQALIATLLWFWLSHRNPSLSPVRKTQADIIRGGGFTFFSFGRKRPWFLDKARDESGLLWEGFTIGVCRPNSHDSLYEGKVYSIAVWLYGTNEGVGHYSYKARSDRFSGFYGEGHFNLMPFEVGSDSWMTRVLAGIGNSLARDLEAIIRPIDVAYDRKTGALTMYDPVSGRDVRFSKDRVSATDGDLFVFGPHPSKMPGQPATPPGIAVKPTESQDSQDKYLHIQPAVDIHGRMVSRVNVTIECAEGSGYSYTQQLSAFAQQSREVVITIPRDMNKVRIRANRGGFHNLESTVSIDGSKDVFVRMEPTT